MDFFVISDIHGSKYWLLKALEKYRESGCEKILILGDILYHGPRNDLPKEYAPKEVIAMLNPLKDRILSVRGNCEAEVDQMVLDFPCMADYGIVSLGERTVYMTHGHIYNEKSLPPIVSGDIILHGHTHVLKAEKIEREDLMFYHLNPGSISIPKENNPSTYGILNENGFRVLDFSGNIVKEIKF